MASSELVLVDDKESRFWTIERQSSILSPGPVKSRQRKMRPLSFLRSASREAQEENLSRDADSIHEADGAEVIPFSAPVQKRLPLSHSASMLSRKFNFYFWSSQVPDCYAADLFMLHNSISPPPRIDAESHHFPAADALRFVRSAKRLIVVSSPKESTKLVITPETTNELLASLVLDSRQQLKAPCVRVGGTIVVGFSPSVYKTCLFFGNMSPPEKKPSRLKRLSRGASAISFKGKQAPTENTGNFEEPAKRYRPQRAPLSPTPADWTPKAR